MQSATRRKSDRHSLVVRHNAPDGTADFEKWPKFRPQIARRCIIRPAIAGGQSGEIL
jgi:hypothetical protein